MYVDDDKVEAKDVERERQREIEKERETERRRKKSRIAAFLILQCETVRDYPRDEDTVLFVLRLIPKLSFKYENFAKRKTVYGKRAVNNNAIKKKNEKVDKKTEILLDKFFVHKIYQLTFFVTSLAANMSDEIGGTQKREPRKMTNKKYDKTKSAPVRLFELFKKDINTLLLFITETNFENKKN